MSKLPRAPVQPATLSAERPDVDAHYPCEMTVVDVSGDRADCRPCLETYAESLGSRYSTDALRALAGKMQTVIELADPITDDEKQADLWVRIVERQTHAEIARRERERQEMTWPIMVLSDGWSLEFFPAKYVILRTPDEDRHDGDWSTYTARNHGDAGILELEDELDELLPDGVHARLMSAAVKAGGGLLGDTFVPRKP
jgi:hypothetical protein